MSRFRTFGFFLVPFAFGCGHTAVTIISDPPAANVAINGNSYGKTPVTASLRTGVLGTGLFRPRPYPLVASYDGYAVYQGVISSGSESPYRIKLSPIDPEAQTKKSLLAIYREGAEAGDAVAQFWLAMLYWRGKETRQDHDLSFDWFKKSGEQGYARALYMIGMSYESAKGAVQSNSAAADWFYKAARQFLADGDRDMALASMDRIIEMEKTHPLATALKAEMYSDNLLARQRTAGDRIGTGFSITKDGLIVTAYHVVKDAARILVRFPGREPVEATFVKGSEAVDLATLKVGVADVPWIELADPRSVAQGAKVSTLGYPAVSLLGEDVKYAEGTVSSLTGLQGDATSMQVSIPIQPGNSGGPVLNDQYQVIAVVTSTAAIGAFLRDTGNLPQNINWAVKIEAVEPLLEQKPATYPSDAPKRGMEQAKRAVCMIIAKGARDKDGVAPGAKPITPSE